MHLPEHALLSEGFTPEEIANGITLYEPVGCADCTEGYKGRTGIYQVMPMTDQIQAIILEGGNAMQIAEAAQTGHMELSTLHTNDAPQTISRLMNMGIAPFNITSSVTVVIAQRLARRLHDACKKPQELPEAALLAEGFTEEEVQAGMTLYEAGGCSECTEGYKGRTGSYQVMPMTDEIQAIVLAGGNVQQIAEAAQKSRVRDLRQSAMLKVKNGITSLAEINRVTKD